MLYYRKETSLSPQSKTRSSVETSIGFKFTSVKLTHFQLQCFPTLLHAPRKLAVKFRIITVRNRPGPAGFSDTGKSNILKTSRPSAPHIPLATVCNVPTRHTVYALSSVNSNRTYLFLFFFAIPNAQCKSDERIGEEDFPSKNNSNNNNICSGNVL